MSEMNPTELITSKDIFLLTRDFLYLYDERPMRHGICTAYIFHHMLKERGGMEEYEIADWDLIAMLHDIGVYKMSMFADGNSDVALHSVYSYLFMRYLSPVGDRAKVILYHHVDWNHMQTINYKYRDIAQFIHIAAAADRKYQRLGEEFDYRTFLDEEDKFCPEARDLFEKAMEHGNLQKDILDGSYEKKFEELLDYALLSDIEKQKYTELMMFCVGFRDTGSVKKTISTIYCSMEIARHLKVSPEDITVLEYAAIVHDLGMIAIPSEILNAPRKLTDEERKIMQTHVEIARKVLTKYLPKNVVDVACAHHERFDGSGYPRGLKGNKMTELQAILQVADTVAALKHNRPYADAQSLEEIRKILKEGVSRQKFSKQVADVAIIYLEAIGERVDPNIARVNKLYDSLMQKMDEMVQNGSYNA